LATVGAVLVTSPAYIIDFQIGTSRTEGIGGLTRVQFGLFGSATAGRGGGPDVDSGAGFRTFIENNVEAEALGYVSSFLVEHHFTGFGQVSATLNLLTWLGARTTTLRLGTAVIVLPWHNPVLLAEQVATVDLLSGGRMDFGVGKGYRHNEFAGFCLPIEESQDRFEESLDVMTRAWTSDTRWSHHGKYWQFEDVVVEPAPKQKPHPPIWMGAGSEGSIKSVAAHGFNLLLDQYASIEQVGERIALYRSELDKRGRPWDPARVGLTRSLSVVTSASEREAAIEHRLAHREQVNQLARRPDGHNDASFFSYADTAEMAEAGALYGTPDEIAGKLEALRDVGAEYILLNTASGIRSLRRFAHEIMPAYVASPRAEQHILQVRGARS
jgi:alkanesulfonate monooxygenase SsuD/methylene tetrahydromethanopterin reductase-like flavin-dependent oxidoreductase (luciferase family)